MSLSLCRPSLVLAALAVSTLALGACGSEPTIPTGELEERVAALLQEETGNTPDEVSCPDELPARKGESVRCTYRMLGYEVGASVTVRDEPDGDSVRLDIQVDDEPISGPGSPRSGAPAPTISAEEVARKASDALTESVGQTPDSVECPDDLPATVGARTRCTLTHGGDSLGVTVEVTSVDDDGDYHLDVQVDEG